MLTDIQIGTLVATAGLTGYFCFFVWFSDKFANFLYSKGYLARCKTSIDVEKQPGRKTWTMLLEAYIIAYSTFVLPTWVLVKNYMPLLHKLDFSFNILHAWISLCGIYICFDVCYYYLHRKIHENPAIYKFAHKRHHEILPIDSYLTARADFLENIILTTPGLTLFMSLLTYFSPTPNFWLITLPVVTLLHDFNLLHIGFYDDAILFLINPLSLIVQYSLGARHMTARHELHHNLFTKNYSPVLPWLDRFFGTGKELGREHWNISAVTESKK